MSDLWQPPECIAERADLAPGACLDGAGSRCLDQCRLTPPEPGPTPADVRGEPHTAHRYPTNRPLTPVYVDATQGVVIYDFADRPTTVIDGECRECDPADLEPIPDAPPQAPGADPWEGWVLLGATQDGTLALPSGSLIEPGPGTLYAGPASSTMSFDLDQLSAENLVAALTGETLWTIGDALQFLDPAPPRRTVSRWLAKLPAIGWRQLPQGGPPARTYRASDVMARHARWAKSHPPAATGQ